MGRQSSIEKFTKGPFNDRNLTALMNLGPGIRVAGSSVHEHRITHHGAAPAASRAAPDT
jgi:hypothetical protein